MESEYARLCLEEGIPGVLLWIWFVGWALLVDPRGYRKFGGSLEAGGWAVSVLAWIQAAVGTGLLASVPVTLLLFIYMGALAGQRMSRPVVLPERPHWTTPAGFGAARPDA
jgi:hypothetical protein